MGLVLSLIWRQIGSVCELARVVNGPAWPLEGPLAGHFREMVLWVPRMKITQQAINTRLRVIPAELFLNVLTDILPVLQARWERRERPLPEAMAWAKKHYKQVVICDGSTLDALIRKVGLLKDEVTHPLAGRMTALLDGMSRLPIWIGYTPSRTYPLSTKNAGISEKVGVGPR